MKFKDILQISLVLQHPCQGQEDSLLKHLPWVALKVHSHTFFKGMAVSFKVMHYADEYKGFFD